jgi:hypothetical protein
MCKFDQLTSVLKEKKKKVSFGFSALGAQFLKVFDEMGSPITFT